MWETIIVILVVGAAAVFAIRAFYRTLTSKEQGCSGCNSSCQCDHQPDAAAEQTDRCR
ncbi:MAG: FeoB-associated Cys-rich membrane protein [Armatimonadota bacterium]